MNNCNRIMVFLFVACFSVLTVQLYATGETNDYVIYCHSSLLGTATDSLCANLVDRGYNPITVSVASGTSRSWITSDIKSRYFGSAILPQYILLIGAMRADSQNGNDSVSGTPSGNLIPSYWETDYFGTRAAYDNYFVSVDTSQSAYQKTGVAPVLYIGRVPASSLGELSNYVKKLCSYTQSSLTGSWRTRALVLGGDLNRGAWPDYPTPEMVNSENALLQSTYLLAPFTSSLLKYSDYQNDADRKSAFVSSLNSGQLLVSLLATGANMGNFGYIVNHSTFDANSDLNNAGMLPVVFGTSCNVGQTDYLLPGDTKGVIENALFANNTGIIAAVVPTGFTAQNSNFGLIEGLFSAFLARGNNVLGPLLADARSTRERSASGPSDTYYMYEVLGDPALRIATASSNIGHFSNLSFEFADHSVKSNSISGTYASNLVSGIRARSEGAGLKTNQRTFFCSGHKNLNMDYGAFSAPFVDDQWIVLSADTRFLTFTIRAIESPPNDDAGYSIDGALQSGTLGFVYANGDYLRDQYGTRLFVNQHEVAVGQSKFFAVDLQRIYGSRIVDLKAVGSFPMSTLAGDFEVEFDDIRFSPTWGGSPAVDPIDFPNEVIVSSQRQVQVLASDVDIITGNGDALSYSWQVSAGTLSGGGTSIKTYTAPAMPTVDVVLTVTVTDKGAHSVVVTKTFDVVNEDIGCPVLSVWNGREFKDLGVILTESEDVTRLSQKVTDHVNLGSTVRNRPGELLLRISENEQEISNIDNVQIEVSDFPARSGFEPTFTSRGEMVLFGDPIAPTRAYNQNGREVTPSVRLKDDVPYLATGPGYLILMYDISSNLAKPISGAEVMTDGGGGGSDPPDKELYKQAVADDSYDGVSPNILTYSVMTTEGEFVTVDKIFPRTKREMAVVDLSEYLPADGKLTVKLEWTRGYSIDFAPYYRLVKPSRMVRAIDAISAHKNSRQDVLSDILAVDNESVSIAPSDYMDIRFPLPNLEASRERIVKLVSIGYYQRLSDVPAADGSADDDNVGTVVVEQNQPNPFNPSTTIRYSVGRESAISVRVLNVLGQVVRTLYDGRQPAGNYQLTWEGTDGNGANCASGVYFYVVQAEGTQISRKMLLMR